MTFKNKIEASYLKLEYITQALIKHLAPARQWPGPGRRTRDDSVLGPVSGPDELASLLRWLPDVAERDVFLCGPTVWTDGVEALLLAAGTPADRIHAESFGW